MPDFQKVASNALTKLRSGTKDYEMWLKHLRHVVKEGRFTLKDVGTTEEELEELRIKGCLERAKMWLGHLNGERPNEPLGELAKNIRPKLPGLIEDELRVGGLTFGDLGVTREEIELMAVKIAEKK